MHTIIHGTLCYWPLCSRLGRCPCSLSALRGEMPWKHIRQPFQLPCTDEGDLTWDLGAWNKTLEGRQLNCVVQQPFHIFKGRKAKSASHFTPRMAWGWSVPPSAIPGSSDGHGGGGTAVWSLPALGLRRAMGPKQGGSYSVFFFSVSAEPVARWLPGTDAGPCGDPHVLRRSDQAEPGTWGSYQGARWGNSMDSRNGVLPRGTYTKQS